MPAYSAAADLLLGKIPLPSYIDPNAVVQDAADEIDSKIGHVYSTPINVSETGPLVRPARLLLKRINNHLATGRLILQVASPEENKNLHAYGWQLVKEATAAIEAIVSGDVPLEGATLIETAGSPATVPMINNLDTESNVEAFYDRIVNPDYNYILPVKYNPDSLVQ